MLIYYGATTHRGSGLLAVTLTVLLALLVIGPKASLCQDEDTLRSLRVETAEIFYHGFRNYMEHAFPDDELKPVSCQPLTRDRNNPAHIEVNDVLGNYSLTLVDSLSTLAILASSSDLGTHGYKPLQDFQEGIRAFVELYGDGSDGAHGIGLRGQGFDLDSKVQVFETVIRGVGGLLSAHLFAIGELPIQGYRPTIRGNGGWFSITGDTSAIVWNRGFEYNGQLLRLAYDLASRLLPAFDTPTGLPYPRVNLRHGAHFYRRAHKTDSSRFASNETISMPREITETCSAGAGSLVLEFTTLSRLTGDNKFERLAKRAFKAVWDHRTAIDLVGAGIDAETGQWVGTVTGVGAGIDSFFEYAFKSHVLLSGLENQVEEGDGLTPDFLGIWQQAHVGIKRHLYRGSAYQHPHYIQGDINTGAARAFWIDSLSAYYPGLLTLAGELDEAIETHLLHAALWTRYSGLPERWSALTGGIESGLKWWGGRPEFIESTWYLYHATKDPWYIYVGKMVLHDIRRRCWTPCGWAGLEDVRTGELKDRMESFFLGETVKYLYLLFDKRHPLNKLDSPIVFTTEGHPLKIPRATVFQNSGSRSGTSQTNQTCPLPPPLLPLSISATAARSDFFHAASLARLHRVNGYHSIANETVESAHDGILDGGRVSTLLANNSFYPWTLPKAYIPSNGFSDRLGTSIMFDLSFPTLSNSISGALTLKRVNGGVVVNSVSGLKFNMVQEPTVLEDVGQVEAFRVLAVSHVTLGRDENVFLPVEVASKLNPTDPYFTRYKDLVWLDIVVETNAKLLTGTSDNHPHTEPEVGNIFNKGAEALTESFQGSIFKSFFQHVSAVMEQSQQPLSALLANVNTDYTTISNDRAVLDAITATGPGAGFVADTVDASFSSIEPLQWHTIFVGGQICHEKLAANVPKEHQVIVIKRGQCSFAQKLQNIPAYSQSSSALQLVVVVSDDEDLGQEGLTRPLVHEVQMTPGGIRRLNAIPLVMVGGGNETMDMLREARSIGVRRRYRYESQGLRISNLYVV